jgi:hypothetical protein
MPLFSKKNVYQGVNAHLNSLLQNQMAEWDSFHNEHIIHIQRVLNADLPEGYYTRAEKLLQAASLALYEDVYTSIVIYEASNRQAVVCIELLSPVNKQPGTGYVKYGHRRKQIIDKGLCLVEIDYLHEIRPAVAAVPSYAAGYPGAQPYYVLLTEPGSPTPHLTAWGVDEAIPSVDIPLNTAKHAVLSLDQAYQQTFNDSTFYPLVVDYERVPVAFETYTRDDQARIRAVIERAKKPAEPEASPLVTPSLQPPMENAPPVAAETPLVADDADTGSKEAG